MLNIILVWVSLSFL